MKIAADTYLVIRNGAVKMRLQKAAVEPSGAISCQGCYVIDGELAKTDGVFDVVAALARAKRWASIDRQYLGKVGTSASGLRIVSEADYQREQTAEIEPEWRERQAITALFERANGVQYEDTEQYFHLLHKAEAQLAAWQASYPAAAVEEKRIILREEADHARQMALGALTYDMDGSLSAEAQQAMHDGLMAKAALLDAQAAAL